MKQLWKDINVAFRRMFEGWRGPRVQRAPLSMLASCLRGERFVPDAPFFLHPSGNKSPEWVRGGHRVLLMYAADQVEFQPQNFNLLQQQPPASARSSEGRHCSALLSYLILVW